MAEDTSGKTEEPTPKRLREARAQGQFPRTQDASTWAGIAAAAATLPMTADRMQTTFRELFAMLPQVGADPTDAQVLRVVAELPMAIIEPTLPMAIAAFVAALAVTAAQGVHPSKKALQPKANRMSPKQGIKRMFGGHAVWEAAKALVKVAVIAAVVFFVGKGLVVALMGGGVAPIGATVSITWSGLRAVLWAGVLAGALLTVADYAYQRHRVMKQLRMSPKEIKDEHKQSEGDPLIKSAIRSRQIAMSRNRMLSNVATADAVLVNPTHIAVAVRYEPGKGAPRVVAKGSGALALKIRELAAEHRVPILEDKPLARALFRICEVDDEIPAELYLAVAKILAFVMAVAKGRGAQVPRPRATDVPDLPTKSELAARRVRELREARRS